MQRATVALVAARLSRGLERDRIETDGRFARAIRVAQSHGIRRQHLEAVYEAIWTAFWWFDDFTISTSTVALRTWPTSTEATSLR